MCKADVLTTTLWNLYMGNEFKWVKCIVWKLDLNKGQKK